MTATIPPGSQLREIVRHKHWASLKRSARLLRDPIALLSNPIAKPIGG
jgi:hypothetical protein